MRLARLGAALAGGALLTLGGFAAPSPAAETVTVGFGLAAGTYAPTGVACQVEVAPGADGIAVLDAAVAKGCIVSYRKVDYPSGAFVDCINEVCSAPAEALYATYWHAFVNGASASSSVSSFSASEGAELVFSYTTWAVAQPV